MNRGRIDIDQGGCAWAFGGLDLGRRRGPFLFGFRIRTETQMKETATFAIDKKDTEEELGHSIDRRHTSSAVCFGPLAAAAAYDMVILG